MTRRARTIGTMIPTVAAGIFAALATRGAIAWRDSRARRRDDVPLEARLARAVARAEAEARAQDSLRAA